MKITRVERPPTKLAKDPLYSALLATARNGSAVAVDLTGKAFTLAQARARAWAKRKKYLLHYQHTADGGVVMWLERKGKHNIHEEDGEEVVHGEDAGTEAS